MTAKTSVIAIISSMLLQCTTTHPNLNTPAQAPAPALSKEGQVEHHDSASPIWYKGSVEQAFAEARTTKKPLFLYWGAVWCPPCNEIKSQLFSKPRFTELMASFIAVYIDGDADNAQAWSDKLGVFGYPTLVIFNADGQEVVRLREGVNIEEFEIAVASVLNNLETLNKTIDRCLAGKGREHDWRLLAYVNWGSGADDELDAKTSLLRHQQLIQAIPPALAKEKMLLTIQLLMEAYENKDNPEVATIVAAVIKQREAHLELIFSSRDHIIAARNFLVYSPEIMGWLYSSKSASSEQYKNKWLAAAALIAADNTLSIDVRMSAVVPALQFHEFEHGTGAPLPASLVTEVKQAVATAMGRLVTSYERHAVVSSAAALLIAIHDYDGAEQLLTTELKTTDTPWYYYSSLADLEQERTNTPAALKYASLARQSAKGGATKLQWVTSDLLLSLEYDKDNETHILELIGEFYELATAHDDGFRGRNYLRVQKVGKKLQPFLQQPQIKNRIQPFAARCHQLAGSSQERCRLHFKGMI